MKLVIFPPIDADRLQAVREAAGPTEVINAENDLQAIEAMVEADAFFGKLTPDILAAATRLRWVQSATASLEHYIFPELVQHDCVLTNMRGLFGDVVADHVFGYILCFARNLHLYIRQQIERHWEPVGGELSRGDFVSGPGTVSAMDRGHQHVSDCTLGIVGFGGIGREIARRGRAFGMRVLAVDANPTDDFGLADELWPVDSLKDLLAESDFVVIAAPHTPETERLFVADKFRAMKESAYLINIGRGAIVSLDALDQAIEDGEIAGAALDVFEQEPLPKDHPLWTRKNVIITPHVAACSVHIAERHLNVLLDNIKQFVADKPLNNVVRKENWY